MTESEMKEHLKEKAQLFVQLLPENLRVKFHQEMYFAGGCIYSLANNKEPKDYDIFLASDKLIKKLKSLDIWVHKSDNALSYGKFQVVTKFYGKPKEVVGQFDFKHNMHWYKPFENSLKCGYEEELGYREAFIEDWKYLYTNELIFNKNRARDCDNVWLRIDKFVKRGMKISRDTKKQILAKTSKKEIRKARKLHSSSGGGCNGGCY